ncbi:MAG: hypothetical protein K9L28_00695 [Synergistales bacterium]|nr:hypothetical protein [Synergistales bacterium]
MRDLPFSLEEHNSWKEMRTMAAQGRLPQSLGVLTVESCFVPLAERFGQIYLSGRQDAATQEDSEANHPDLLFAAEPGKPPGIRQCRQLAAELTLQPVATSCRVGVIFHADRLSPAAANSLLKLLEEPPPKARLLLFMETEATLPTIISRLWTLRIKPEIHRNRSSLPQNDHEWVEWFRGMAQSTKEDARLSTELDGLVTASIACRRYETARRLETLRRLAENGRLSQSMLMDLACLAVKEEYPIEHVFDNFW